MTNPSDRVHRYYDTSDLGKRILNALQQSGKDVDHLTRDDLAGLDEFHNGGRAATRALAVQGELRPGMRVLDVGAGIGGPARTLAAEFGCDVVGLDLSESFCEAAALLSARVGMHGRVRFQQGDALDMPFDDGSFDALWTQNVLMNVEDKRRLFAQFRRVLRPQGRLIFQTIVAGPVPGVHYPVMWARDAGTSFLEPPDTLRQMLSDAGFRELVWVDVSSNPEMTMSAGIRAADRRGAPPLPAILFPDEWDQIRANIARNREENRLLIVYAVYERE